MRKLFIILPMLLALCSAVSCQDKAAMVELEQLKAQAKIEEQNKAVYRNLIEELNKGNAETLRELFAPDYGYYSPSRSTKPLSREEGIEFQKTVFRAFPDSNWSIEELIAEGNKVVGRLVFRGTHEGVWQSVSATGNKVEISLIGICHIENGKAVAV